MKGKSSCRVKGMEAMGRTSNLREEPRLSGAYIRSLVKHLSSSRIKVDQTMNPNSPNSTLEDHLDEPRPLQSPPPPPPPPHKKQVRRRLPTSRPYQERLLNMAEARREIVTALKFHRAAMKQANEQQQQQSPPPPSPLEDSCNPNIYQPNQPTFWDPSLPPFPYTSFSWSNNSDNLNLPLPNQPLGLNLNLQGFNNIDTSLYNSNATMNPLVQPLPPHSSYSYSSPPMCGIDQAMEIPQTVGLGAHDANVDLGDAKLHIAMDEKEMAEIRSIGEKHDIEWNDTVNLMTSAWWSKFLETTEVDPMEGNTSHIFDEAIDIPAWLKDGSGVDDANASKTISTYYLDDYYLQDASLPW